MRSPFIQKIKPNIFRTRFRSNRQPTRRWPLCRTVFAPNAVTQRQRRRRHNIRRRRDRRGRTLSTRQAVRGNEVHEVDDRAALATDPSRRRRRDSRRSVRIRGCPENVEEFSAGGFCQCSSRFFELKSVSILTPMTLLGLIKRRKRS